MKLVGRDNRFSRSTSDRKGLFGVSYLFIENLKKKTINVTRFNGEKFSKKITSSVSSTTGVVAAIEVGVDDAIEMGSFSIGGVDDIGVRADV